MPTHAAIRRMARRGGVKRIGADLYAVAEEALEQAVTALAAEAVRQARLRDSAAAAGDAPPPSAPAGAAADVLDWGGSADLQQEEEHVAAGAPQLMIRKLPFQRLLRACVQRLPGGQYVRFQTSAVQACQEAVEAFMIGLFSDANLVAIHERRVTTMAADVRAAAAARRRG